MDLETSFEDSADHHGIFTAKVGMERHRNLFRTALSSAAVNLGVKVGVTETKEGFALGFKNEEDYAAVMEQTEARLYSMFDKKGDSAADRRVNAAMDRLIGSSRSGASPKDGCRGDEYDELCR